MVFSLYKEIKIMFLFDQGERGFLNELLRMLGSLSLLCLELFFSYLFDERLWIYHHYLMLSGSVGLEVFVEMRQEGFYFFSIYIQCYFYHFVSFDEPFVIYNNSTSIYGFCFNCKRKRDKREKLWMER